MGLVNQNIEAQQQPQPQVEYEALVKYICSTLAFISIIGTFFGLMFLVLSFEKHPHCK